MSPQAPRLWGLCAITCFREPAYPPSNMSQWPRTPPYHLVSAEDQYISRLPPKRDAWGDDNTDLCYMLRIVEADTPELLARAVEILRDFPPHQRRHYATYLHTVERYFDDAAYARELADLPAHYGPPQGCVLLALEGEVAVGAVCLRRLDDEACEMKRLYVPGPHRGKGIAKALVNALLDAARVRGYALMRLDTGHFMTEALGLYERFGFRRIAAYYAAEPVLATALVFMEREVDPVKSP